nr:uncharacterized protein LOC127326204 [Lolium perenne]
MKLAAFNGIREYINKQWYWQVPTALQITGLVSQHVKSGWKKCIHDVASYKRFKNLRGERAHGRHPQLQLQWSLERPFDQSVFLWHMATDLCFHNHGTGSTASRGQEECINGIRVISNYMMYLLSIPPHMLMLGTRPGILDLAIYELDIILKGSNVSLHNEEALAQEIMNTVKSTAPVPTHEVMVHTAKVEQPVTIRERTYTITHIPEACRLAEELMKLGEEARWTVIRGVWVEMLCYSASRCRGYLHAKSLGEGRE